MSQRNVQLVVGRLLTDEEFRLRFYASPHEVLSALVDRGFALTPGEIDALVSTERALWTDGASRIDQRLQQCRLSSE